jgi:hypothetical protein
MPLFSGRRQLMSNGKQILLVATYNATIIAVWTFLWTRRGAHLVRCCRYITLLTMNTYRTTLQPDATYLQRADKERNKKTVKEPKFLTQAGPAVVPSLRRPRD